MVPYAVLLRLRVYNHASSFVSVYQGSLPGVSQQHLVAHVIVLLTLRQLSVKERTLL